LSITPNKAVEESLAHPLNYGISCNLMDLSEEILRDTNNDAKGYMKIRKVEDDVNRPALFTGTAASF